MHRTSSEFTKSLKQRRKSDFVATKVTNNSKVGKDFFAFQSPSMTTRNIDLIQEEGGAWSLIELYLQNILRYLLYQKEISRTNC